MQAEYVPATVYLEFTFISTEELSFDPNQRQTAKLASMLIVQQRCVPIVRFWVLLTRGCLSCILKTTTLWAFRRCDFPSRTELFVEFLCVYLCPSERWFKKKQVCE